MRRVGEIAVGVLIHVIVQVIVFTQTVKDTRDVKRYGDNLWRGRFL